MKKILFVVLMAGLSTTSLLSQQCLEDRHTTNITDAWLSCQKTMNPNNVSGDSHWILYNFESVHNLYESTLWNINHPDYVHYGVKRIRVDYSLDKINWTYWNELSISEAPARSDYLGEAGPDFDGLAAKHILITVLETHGDMSCAGFSEIRIFTEDPNCPGAIVFESDDNIYGIENYQAIEIVAKNTIHTNADVELKASESIEFLEGFNLNLGAKLKAFINNCFD